MRTRENTTQIPGIQEILVCVLFLYLAKELNAQADAKHTINFKRPYRKVPRPKWNVPTVHTLNKDL